MGEVNHFQFFFVAHRTCDCVPCISVSGTAKPLTLTTCNGSPRVGVDWFVCPRSRAKHLMDYVGRKLTFFVSPVAFFREPTIENVDGEIIKAYCFIPQNFGAPDHDAVVTVFSLSPFDITNTYSGLKLRTHVQSPVQT